ncbi:baseplate J/gp47 family protein [Vibrio campbellii]|uniref:baseplate J/gp47 family protein n=1 Tax=Vibrio campbellii TaxID=680 RepID=UPI001F374754|nr:baseplate J/gp47 family protein [Vibrio campbellii]MCE7729636.1 baseplate J/gp47 family protein [Vibrio campbellii]
MTTNRFPTLPEPGLTTPDYEGELAKLKERYYQKTGHYPTVNDPETFNLEEIAYAKTELQDEINYESKQNLLAYATDGRLENLGALVGVPERLGASAASTVVEFVFKAGHTGTVIPKGFLMLAADGQTQFAAMQDYIVDAGDASLLTNFECLTLGEAGNGFVAGQISTLVDESIPEVESASNITTSQGGASAEDDDRYAYRIYLAPDGWSACGPYDAYEFYALSASSAIGSVAIWTPAPNDISISAILLDGSLPEQPIIDAIYAQCSGKTRVPQGDRVTVVQPGGVNGSVTIELQVYKDYASLGKTIVSTATERINTELLKWRTTHGKDIVVQDLETLCKEIEGVYFAGVTIIDEATGKEIDEIKSISQKERANITLASPIKHVVVDEYSSNYLQ